MKSLQTTKALPHRGVSLIEVLISIVILSIALIGMAGLQASTTAFSLGVSTRASLSALLNDMTGRLRTNLTQVPGFSAAVAAGSYSLATTWSSQATLPSAPAKLCGTESTAESCSPTERATYDLWAWQTKVRQTLPQGSAQLNGTLGTGITVTFMWFDKDNVSNGNLRTAETCDASWATLTSSVSNAIFDASGNATLKRQTCCPASASAPAGVRCANFTVIP